LCGAELEGISLEALTVATGVHVFVVAAPRPFNSGELLVVPRRHLSSLAEMTDDELAEISEWITKAQAAMAEIYHPQGMNVGCTMDAMEAGSHERHLAVRVTPRWTGDTNFMPVIAGVKVLPEALRRTVRSYRDVLSES
jgi:ATP adenylyltransferase